MNNIGKLTPLDISTNNKIYLTTREIWNKYNENSDGTGKYQTCFSHNTKSLLSQIRVLKFWTICKKTQPFEKFPTRQQVNTFHLLKWKWNVCLGVEVIINGSVLCTRAQVTYVYFPGKQVTPNYVQSFTGSKT